jgi:hypothetical protein
MIIVKIFLVLIVTGLIVGLTGTVISFGIDSLTNIDATDAMQVFLIITLVSFALFAVLGMVAAVFSIWTNL